MSYSNEGRNSILHARLFQSMGCELGESPMWHTERRSCFWVDIRRNVFYEYNRIKKASRSWPVDGPVSVVVQGMGDEVFLGMQDGIRRFNLCTGYQELVSDLNRDWQNHRCNDGKCDRRGRLWIGTTDREHSPEKGALYTVGEEATVEKKIDRLTISNGLAWSPDNEWFYHTDSVSREIRSYRYNERTAGITFHEVAVRIPEAMGLPDGMAMDREGMLWIALWGGFGVGRWNPATGDMIGFIEVPAPRVSSCAFTGDDLDELMITTARHGMKQEELASYPLSGDVFIARPPVRGLAGSRCSL